MNKNAIPKLRLSTRSALLAVMISVASLSAADVQTIATVSLETVPYTESGVTYYKYGIYVGIGGGSAQLFEFDTGGDGFYAAYAEGVPWWGSYSETHSTHFSKTFGSGITYRGRSVEASVDLYNAAGGGIAFSSGTTNFKIGRASHIEQSGTPLWPPSDPVSPGPAPIEGNFYGDFGLSLKKESSGIENILAQLTFGSGITKGYKISLGLYGSTSGASLQIGLGPSDLTDANTIWFDMKQPDGSGGTSIHNAEVLLSNISLSYGGDSHTFESLGVNLDTGNPTPGIDYNPSDASRLAPFSDLTAGGDPYQLLTGTTMVLEATPSPPTPPVEDPLTIFSLVAGPDRGVNQVYLKKRDDGGPTYLNIGALLFQQYVVTYDLENGLLGLTPIPEPSALFLGSFAVLITVVAHFKRWSFRRSSQKGHFYRTE